MFAGPVSSATKPPLEGDGISASEYGWVGDLGVDVGLQNPSKDASSVHGGEEKVLRRRIWLYNSIICAL